MYLLPYSFNQDTQNGRDDDDSLSSDDDYIIEESDFEDSDSELFLDSIQECDIRRCGQTTEEEYKQMFTGVIVVKQQDFGSISLFKKQPKNHHPLYNMAKDYIPTHKFVFDSSWACRKGYGKLYGKRYMNIYKEELLKLFEAGIIDSAKKMNPAKMREQLMSMFPHRFSIPSETEIKKFINLESQKLKYRSKKGNPSEQRGRKPKGTNELIWANMLKPMCGEQY